MALVNRELRYCIRCQGVILTCSSCVYQQTEWVFVFIDPEGKVGWVGCSALCLCLCAVQWLTCRVCYDHTWLDRTATASWCTTAAAAAGRHHSSSSSSSEHHFAGCTCTLTACMAPDMYDSHTAIDPFSFRNIASLILSSTEKHSFRAVDIAFSIIQGLPWQRQWPTKSPSVQPKSNAASYFWCRITV